MVKNVPSPPKIEPLPLQRLGGIVWRHRGRCVALLVLAVLGTLLALVFPSLVAWFVDDLIPNGRRELVWQAGALALAAFTLKEALTWGRILCGNALEQQVTVDLRAEFHHRLLRLPVPWFDRQKTGDLMTRMADDIPAMRRVVVEGVEQGVTATLQMIAAATLMFWTDAALTWIVLIPVPLIASGGWLYARWVAPRARTAREVAGNLNASFQEDMAGVRQIKASTAESNRTHFFKRQNESVRTAQTRLAKAWAIYAPSMTLVGHLGLALILVIGSLWCIDGRLTAGELMKFVLLVGFLYEPISRLHGVNQTLQDGLAASARVFGVLDEAEEDGIDEGDSLSLDPVKGALAFQALRFTYPGAKRAAIDGISFEIQPGAMVAVVGASGAGKSTLFHLLARFYEPDSGGISLDGHPIQQIRKASLRKQLSYVAQEPFIFSGSVRENLTLGGDSADDAQLWSALEKSGAAEFVRALPRALDEELGERGVRLSGGEKQRLALARVFLQDAPILLLDEATSALDTLSEKLVRSAIDQLRQGRTTLVIAHRLSTILSADVIHVMRDGQVIASGKHAELIQSCAYYASLAELAFAQD